MERKGTITQVTRTNATESENSVAKFSAHQLDTTSTPMRIALSSNKARMRSTKQARIEDIRAIQIQFPKLYQLLAALQALGMIRVGNTQKMGFQIAFHAI